MNPTVLNRFQTTDKQILPAYTPDKFLAINATTVTSETTILDPTSGKRWRLLGYHLVGSAAGNILLRDNTAGTIVAVIPTAAGGSGVYVPLGAIGIASAAADNLLTAQLSVAGSISGTVHYIEETI